MKYHVLDSGKKSALENMEEDFLLLKNVGPYSFPIVRFYEWSGLSVTHGYFMDPSLFLDPAGSKKHQLQVAKRPTGGGLLFHLLDFTFSLIIPSTHPDFTENVLKSYSVINELVLQAIESTFHVKPSLAKNAEPSSPRGGFCMAKPTVYDLIINDKKVGGAAQRRTKSLLLHQGSINLKVLESQVLREILPMHPGIVQEILQNSVGLMDSNDFFEARNTLKANLILNLNLTR